SATPTASATTGTATPSASATTQGSCTPTLTATATMMRTPTLTATATITRTPTLTTTATITTTPTVIATRNLTATVQELDVDPDRDVNMSIRNGEIIVRFPAGTFNVRQRIRFERLGPNGTAVLSTALSSATTAPTVRPSATATPSPRSSATLVPTLRATATLTLTVSPNAPATSTARPAATLTPTVRSTAIGIPTPRAEMFLQLASWDMAPSNTSTPTRRPSATATTAPRARTTPTATPRARTTPTATSRARTTPAATLRASPNATSARPNAKMRPDERSRRLVLNQFSLRAFERANLTKETKQFKKPVTITIRYDPQTLRGVREQDLALAYWDTGKKDWILIPSKVDRTQHTVTAQTNHFTDFGLVSAPAI
ncbi:MAG: hypothetical protein AB1817_19735, partial [Chloroflexota bacterium]